MSDRERLIRILDEELLIAVYQPLVDLYSAETVGYEALVRGPEGPLHLPLALFGAAREHGLLFELDRACRAAALHGARKAGLREPSTLFVNIEPEALDRLAGSLPELDDAPEGIRMAFEITERSLAARPADLLPLVDTLRRRGVGVALDDVGVERKSLALMPFLRPDVIKLDMSLVQDRPSEAIAEVHNAVSAHAETTGATIVAEGIETPAHMERAQAMGATVGQGWLFGRPGELEPGPPPQTPIRIETPPAIEAQTPFVANDGRRPVRQGSKRLLLEISHEMERRAPALGTSAVLISTFQDAGNFGTAEEELYAGLARALAFVGVLGEGMGTEPAAGVRGGNLAQGDPLVVEWDMVLVSPHFAASLSARETGDGGGPDMDRQFRFQLTHDRVLVLRAARSLMARIIPVDESRI